MFHVFWKAGNMKREFFRFSFYQFGNHQYFLLFIAIKICGTEMDDCHKFATCTDTGPGTHKCTCNEGYTGDGKTCTGLHN